MKLLKKNFGLANLSPFKKKGGAGFQDRVLGQWHLNFIFLFYEIIKKRYFWSPDPSPLQKNKKINKK